MNIHSVRGGDVLHDDLLGQVVFGSDGSNVHPLSINAAGELTIASGSSGVVDTELPAAVAHDDGLTLANAPNVIAASYARDTAAATWSQVSGERADEASVGVVGDVGTHVSDIVKYQNANYTGLNGDYDNVTPTRTASNSQANTRFRQFGLFVEASRTGFPGGPLQIQIEYRTGDQWFRHEGPGGLMEIYPDEIGVGATSFCWEVPAVLGDATRVTITGRGVDASNYYTIADDPPDVVGNQKN